MELVELSPSDYCRLVALWQRVGLPFRPIGRDSQEAFAHQLAGGVQTVLAYREGEALVGAVVITHDSRKGWINRLAVDPAYQRQGIGSRLIAAAEEYLHCLGIQVIAALIHEGNDVSITVFTKAGYAPYPGVLYFSKRTSPED